MATYAFIWWLDEATVMHYSIDEQFHYYRQDGCWELIDLYYNEIGQYKEDGSA